MKGTKMPKGKQPKTETVEKVVETITPVPIVEGGEPPPAKAEKYKITLVEGAKMYGAPGDIDPLKVENMLKEKTEQFDGDEKKAKAFVDATLESFYPDSGWTLLRQKLNFRERDSVNFITDERLMRDFYFRKTARKTYLDEDSRPPQRKFVKPPIHVHRFKIQTIVHETKVVKE